VTAEFAESAKMEERDRLDLMTRRILGVEAHKSVGPGLLESAYRACLAFELRQRGMQLVEQVPVPVVNKDVKLDCGYRLDLRVEDSVIVEIKAIEQLAPIHDAQPLSHLRLASKNVGLLIKFHSRVLKDGFKRIVNEFPDSALSGFSAVNL
jgi:GxxExxY protein